MPKNDPFSPKAIANRIKAKGLQKLRWYCQMCERQMRDENGWKCHCESESHIRQMALFAATPSRFTNDFSHQFEQGFMDIVRRIYRSKRVLANRVYNEYIQDKQHTHMNSTQWESLTGFVKYLGRSGKCVVEETPKGWYITYIEQDPEMRARAKAAEQKERMEVDDETRMRLAMKKRIQAVQELEAKRAASGAAVVTAAAAASDELEKIVEEEEESDGEVVEQADDPDIEEGEERDGEDDEKAKSSGGWTAISEPPKEKVVEGEPDSKKQKREKTEEVKEVREEEKVEEFAPVTISLASSDLKRQQLVEQARAAGSKELAKPVPMFFESKPERRQILTAAPARAPSDDSDEETAAWLAPKIVVKVQAKELAEYFNKKAVVQRIHEKYVAELKMIDTGDVLKVDQDQLETVIPATGGRVLVLRGSHRGSVAILGALDREKYCAQLTIPEGPHAGTVLPAVDYSDFSKLA